MSIQDEMQRLRAAKAELASICSELGVPIPQIALLDVYPEYVAGAIASQIEELIKAFNEKIRTTCVSVDDYYYKAGDKYTMIYGDYAIPGIITNASASLIFSLDLPKSMKNVDVNEAQSVLVGNIRTSRGYILASDNTVLSGSYNFTNNLNVTFNKINDKKLNITIKNPNTSDKFKMYNSATSTSAGTGTADNNTPIMLYLQSSGTQIAFS